MKRWKPGRKSTFLTESRYEELREISFNTRQQMQELIEIAINDFLVNDKKIQSLTLKKRFKPKECIFGKGKMSTWIKNEVHERLRRVSFYTRRPIQYLVDIALDDLCKNKKKIKELTITELE